jgi:hypothetical protein
MNPQTMFPGDTGAASSASDINESVIVSGAIRVVYHRDLTTRIVLHDGSEIILSDPFNHILRYWPKDDEPERLRVSQDPEKFLRYTP